MRGHRGPDDIDFDVVEWFLGMAEGVRKQLITDILDSASDVRSRVQELTIAEAYVAYQYERDTYARTSILTRLEQRMRGRASELVQQYFDSLKGE